MAIGSSTVERLILGLSCRQVAATCWCTGSAKGVWSCGGDDVNNFDRSDRKYALSSAKCWVIQTGLSLLGGVGVCSYSKVDDATRGVKYCKCRC